MNVEFLQRLGINDEDPNVVISKLGDKENELLNKKNIAEAKGEIDSVKEIESLLEQLKKEMDIVKEEAKTHDDKKGANASEASQPKSSESGEYSVGLKYYEEEDFDNAFKCFFNIAEKKKFSDATEKHECKNASYLLANMFKNGIGTSVDIDRSNHYLKRAADLGYDQAQLEYGELLLSQHLTTSEADSEARKNGWKYIEKAADSGLVDAIKKYIDLTNASADTDRHVFAKAKIYNSVMKEHLDTYEAQKCDDRIKEIKKAEKEARKKASYSKKYIIGKLIYLLGTIYLFKGLNPVFFEDVIPQIGLFVPDVPEVLILKWPQLIVITEPYMTLQGVFGGWLILLGNLIRGLGAKKAFEYNRKFRVFGLIINIIIIGLCIAHFVANVIETSNLFGNGSYMQFLYMFASIMIGHILGWIIYKIIK